MEIKNINQDDYNNLADELDLRHYLHSIKWSEFREASGWGFEFIGFYEGNELKASANLRYKKIPKLNYYFYYIPRGFIIDYSDFDLLKEVTETLKKYLKTKNAFMFKIDPDIKRHTIDVDKNILEDKENNYELMKYLNQIGYKHQGFFDYNQGIQPRYTFRNYLSEKTEDQIFSELRASYKTKIKQAKKKGIQIERGNKNNIDDFMELLESTGEKLSEKSEALIRDKEYFLKMYEHYDDETLDMYLAYVNSQEYLDLANSRLNDLENNLGKVESELKEEELSKSKEKKLKNKQKELERMITSAKLEVEQGTEFVAEHPNKVYLGGAIYVKEGKKVWYLYGARNYKYNKIKVTEYLFNTVMNIYANSGFEFFDLYGVGGDISKDSPTYSLYDFKRGFGGEYIEFIGEYDYPINNVVYNLYKFLIQKDTHEQKGIRNIINKILLRK